MLKVYEPQSGGVMGRVEWLHRGEIRAERLKMDGSRGVNAGEILSEYAVRWNIRAAHNLKEGWRVEYDGTPYEIRAIIPNKQKGMKTLITESVNV